MKIGIDLRRVELGETGGLTQWLRGTLNAVFERDTRNTYVLFTTIFNYHLFPESWSNVSRRTISVPRYYDELQDHVTYNDDFDLMLRCDPGGALTRFPPNRQIVCIPDWQYEKHTELLDPTQLRERRLAARAYQSDAGAIATPTETTHREVLADPWTTIDDVFLMPTDAPPLAADALLAAFERVVDRANTPAAHVRVSTPPTVSIVTPSFNQGGFIRQTIESVLTQDYPHIDYRVTDGGSTDDTVAILKSYGDRVKWVSERDRGQTHAINKGMAEATGEIRAYLNSDDLLRPGAVSRVVDHFRARPSCDLVYGRDAIIDAEGAYLGMYPTAEYSFERLVENCCISQPAAFWRKRLADQIGPFDESLKLVMDFEYWLRAGCSGGVLEHITDVLAQTRIHRQSKSSGSGKAETHRRTFYKELFDVSFRHAGYVSSRYVHNWLYSSVLNPRPWTRAYDDLMLRICQRWYHHRFRCGQSRWMVARSIFGDEWWLVVRRLLRPLDPRRLFRPRAIPLVALESDLWLGPELTVAHGGGPLRLTGVPSRDSVLRVFRGPNEVAAVPLKGDEPTDVCVDVPPGPPTAPLRLVFSDSELLPDGRAVSFKLLGTTLFTERDVA